MTQALQIFFAEVGFGVVVVFAGVVIEAWLHKLKEKRYVQTKQRWPECAAKFTN